MAFGQLQVLLFHEAEHGAFRQLVERALADHALTTGVDTKEEVKHETYDRHKENDQHPGHGLGGLPVVHYDMDDGQCHNEPVENYACNI